MNSPYSIEKLNTISESNFSRNDNLIEIRNQVINLEENNKILQGENERLINLNHILQKERIELKSINESKDNIIKDQILLLNNLKSKNEKLENQLLSYEKLNSDLNYAIIELNQKNKTLISNQNILLSSSNQKEIEDKLINITQQLDSLSIIKSRLEHDNKLLLNQINQLQSKHENEINMLKKIQNSEILKQNKIISNLQNGLNNLQLNTSIDINNNSNIQNKSNIFPQSLMDEFLNFEKKTKMIKEDNIKLYSILNDLENKIKIYKDNIERKDNYIKELQSNLRNVENNLKIKNEEIDLINKDNFYQMEKCFKERNELINENNNLKNAYEYCNTGIKDINELFNQKNKNFQTLISNYNKKIKELEFQLQQSNQKNEILNLEIEKLKRKNKRYEKKDINLKKKIPFQKRNLSFNGSGKSLLNNSNTINSTKNNNEQYMNNTFSGNLSNEYNINTYNSNFSKIKNRKINTTDFSSININLEDPFFYIQHKSLEDFKTILQKVDENLSENTSFINKIKDLN